MPTSENRRGRSDPAAVPGQDAVQPGNSSFSSSSSEGKSPRLSAVHPASTGEKSIPGVPLQVVSPETATRDRSSFRPVFDAQRRPNSVLSPISERVRRPIQGVDTTQMENVVHAEGNAKPPKWQPTQEDFDQNPDETMRRVIEEYGERLNGRALSIVGDRDTADDVVQKTLVSVLTARGSFADRTNFGAWVDRICKNHAIDHWRTTRGPRTREVLTPDGEPIDSVQRSPRRWEPLAHVDDVSAIESSDQIPVDPAQGTTDEFDATTALRDRLVSTGLHPDTASTVIMRDVEGLSYDEIAARAQTDLRTVVSHLHKGRLVLREIAAGDKPDQVFGDIDTSGFVNGDPKRAETGAGADIETAFRDVMREGKVPDDQVEAVVLREMYGFTNEQIAEAQGIAENTVRTRLHRGRRQANALLGADVVEKIFDENAANRFAGKGSEAVQTTPEGWDDFLGRAREARMETVVRDKLADVGLSPLQMEYVIAYGVKGKSLQEIADERGKTKISINVRITDARAKIQETLGHEAVKEVLDFFLEHPIRPKPVAPNPVVDAIVTERLAETVVEPEGRQIDLATVNGMRTRLVNNAKISPDQADIIVLKSLVGLSVKEIAENLNITEVLARKRLENGRGYVRDRMGMDAVVEIFGTPDARINQQVRAERIRPGYEVHAVGTRDRLMSAGLSRTQADIYAMKWGEGLTTEQIAQRMGVSTRNIRNKIKSYVPRISRLFDAEKIEAIRSGAWEQTG